MHIPPNTFGASSHDIAFMRETRTLSREDLHVLSRIAFDQVQIVRWMLDLMQAEIRYLYVLESVITGFKNRNLGKITNIDEAGKTSGCRCVPIFQDRFFPSGTSNPNVVVRCRAITRSELANFRAGQAYPMQQINPGRDLENSPLVLIYLKRISQIID